MIIHDFRGKYGQKDHVWMCRAVEALSAPMSFRTRISADVVAQTVGLVAPGPAVPLLRRIHDRPRMGTPHLVRIGAGQTPRGTLRPWRGS